MFEDLSCGFEGPWGNTETSEVGYIFNLDFWRCKLFVRGSFLCLTPWHSFHHHAKGRHSGPSVVPYTVYHMLCTIHLLCIFVWSWYGYAVRLRHPRSWCQNIPEPNITTDDFFLPLATPHGKIMVLAIFFGNTRGCNSFSRDSKQQCASLKLRTMVGYECRVLLGWHTLLPMPTRSRTVWGLLSLSTL